MVLATVSAVALTACGSSAPSTSSGTDNRSASTLVSQMKTAVRNASSVHMTGRLTSAGQHIGLNISVLRNGGLNGTIAQGKVPLQLIGAGGKVYVKATPAFLRELNASSVCSLMCGKWVQMSGSQADQLTGSLSLASLTKSLTTGLPEFTKTGTTTVTGQPAIELKGADNSILDVAATGKPYPLRVVAPRGGQGSVVFSQWDSVPAPKAPPSSQVINLDKLKAGTS